MLNSSTKCAKKQNENPTQPAVFDRIFTESLPAQSFLLVTAGLPNPVLVKREERYRRDEQEAQKSIHTQQANR